jgi:lipopolysaccharide transport system permease protein
VDYALGIFIGLTLLHVISETLGLAPGLIVGNPNFVKKVVFPLEVLPAAMVGAALIHMLISLVLTLVSLLVAGVGLTFTALWVPAIILPVVLLSLGIGWFFSALGVFFRDLGQIVQFLSMVLLWCSGVFFTAQKYPAAWIYLRFNPLLLAIEMTRDALLWHRPINLAHLAYIYVVGLSACYLGYTAFRRMRPAFADVL